MADLDQAVATQLSSIEKRTGKSIEHAMHAGRNRRTRWHHEADTLVLL